MKRSKYTEPLRARIREIAMTRVRYGFWRIYVLLRREGWEVNHNAYTGSTSWRG